MPHVRSFEYKMQNEVKVSNFGKSFMTALSRCAGMLNVEVQQSCMYSVKSAHSLTFDMLTSSIIPLFSTSLTVLTTITHPTSTFHTLRWRTCREASPPSTTRTWRRPIVTRRWRPVWSRRHERPLPVRWAHWRQLAHGRWWAAHVCWYERRWDEGT